MKKWMVVLLVLVGMRGMGQISQLWGMTSEGGAFGGGVIFHVNLDGTGFTLVHSFDTSQTGSGFYPCSELFKASNGKLYGMTQNGGLYNSGVMFSFDTTANMYSDLYDFDENCSFNSLIQKGDGKLYGMCESGSGLIFSFDINTNTYTDLHDFIPWYGSGPLGGLVHASNGFYYGTTVQGGIDGIGALFRFDSTSNTYTDLMDFNGQAPIYGWYPHSLIQASDGYLYGTSNLGANNNVLSVYSFNINNNSGTYLNGLNNMLNPCGHLVQASDGKLYGLTTNGGADSVGGIYIYNPSDYSIADILDFNHLNGANPQGSLVASNNGFIYGMTKNGGANGMGVLFSYDIVDSIYSDIFDFNGANGKNPLGSLIILSDSISTGFIQFNNSIYQISLYPNPFSTTATLVINGVETQCIASLQIYNLLGQEVKTIPINNQKEIPIKVGINRDNLPDGMYFYKIITNKNETLATGKMVIQ